MKKIPVILQHDAMDCGVACIAMVCAWYGIPATIPALKEVCVPTREGVSMKKVAATLEMLGFRVVGGRATTRLLVEKAVLPVILHWNQNHFVVLFRISRRRGRLCFHISDPAVGEVVYTQEEFERSWVETRSAGEDKGIALFIYSDHPPGAKNHQKPDNPLPRRSLRILLPYFIRYRGYFALLVGGYLCISLVQLVFPYLTKSIVDVGIADSNLNFIILILLAQLALLLGSTFVRFVNNWVTLHISTRISLSLVSDFLIKLMRLPMDFFDHRQVGDTVQRIGDHERVQSFITTESLTLLYSLVSLLVFSVVMLTYDGLIFSVFIGFSAAYFLWLLFFMKQRKALDYKFFALNAESHNITYRLVNGMQEAKLQNITQEQRWKWEDVRADLFDAGIKQMKLSQTQQIGAAFINESKNIVVTILAASSVISGDITLGMMLAIQYIIGQLSLPVSQLANYVYKLQDVRISLERIGEVREKPDENNARTQPFPATGDNTIRITDLSFRYEGCETDVLKHIDLTIAEGETVAIVGGSGSGKTTLLKLLLQYYTLRQGSITIGGTDLRKVNVQALWEHCGVVMQDGYIFSDTIARNIAAATAAIDPERLHHAAKLAMLADFIETLPLRYDTVIGDAGRNLSAGQRQRLLIARVIYKNADFLFFDEATNSLDATNERCILQNIDPFIARKTAVIIAHRLSTVKYADNIVVLEEGRIAECGTHDELLRKRGAYYDLIKNQLELDA